MKFGRKTESWNRLDPNLASFATMAAAGVIGCSFCLDLHYFLTHNRGLDEAKAREVPRWRESTVFTPLERRVMEYAEAMCQTPLTVTDEMSAALLDELGAPALLELTSQDRRHEHDRPGQRRARHPLGGVLGVLRPAAAGGPVRGRSPRHDRRPVSRPPQPAVHRRLRDARLGRRRRRRGAGDLAAVGGGGPGGGARPAGLPRADRHPSGAQPAAHRVAPTRGLRRGVAARTAAHQPGRRRGRRAGGERLHRDADRAGDPAADRARRPRAARGVRRAVRRDRRGRGQVERRGPADRAPRARARGRAAPADGGEPRRAAAGRRAVPRGASPPATCRACWTCSRPTWS